MGAHKEVEDETQRATLQLRFAQQCLLPLRGGECFPRCLLLSLCRECIDYGLSLGKPKLGFGRGGFLRN